MEINRVGTYYRGKRNEKGIEIIEELDNFKIKLDDVGINAIARISENGYYFHILEVYKSGKIYRGQRFHRKYIVTVRDLIFEYYKAENKVPWIRGKIK